MSDAWTAVLVVGVATIAIKAAGPVVAGGRTLPPLAARMLALLPPAVLAALVLTQVFDGGRSLTIDHRAAGVAAAVIALLLRAPTIVVIIVAAATTALLRAA